MSQDDRVIFGWASVTIVSTMLLILGAIRVQGESPPETVTAEEPPRFEASALSTGASRLKVIGTVPVPVESGRVEIDVDGDGVSEITANLNTKILELRVDECPERHYSPKTATWTVDCAVD